MNERAGSWLWMLLITALCFLIGLMGGCTLETTARHGVETVRQVHDDQLVAGETLICGGTLRALLDRYGGAPDKLQSVLALCGYSDYFRRMSGLQ